MTFTRLFECYTFSTTAIYMLVRTYSYWAIYLEKHLTDVLYWQLLFVYLYLRYMSRRRTVIHFIYNLSFFFFKYVFITLSTEQPFCRECVVSLGCYFVLWILCCGFVMLQAEQIRDQHVTWPLCNILAKTTGKPYSSFTEQINCYS